MTALVSQSSCTAMPDRAVKQDYPRIRTSWSRWGGETIRGLEQSGFLHELQELVEECSEPDWDGSGAAPINLSSLAQALDIVRSLSWDVPYPAISVDPASGYLALEWFGKKGWRFLVNVSPGGRLLYAGLFGPNRNSGCEWFTGKLPADISRGIGRVFKSA